MDIKLDRNVVIDISLNDGKITKPNNASYYNTDSNIAFFYVKLHKKDAIDVTEYIKKENASNYKVVMKIVKPKTLNVAELVGTVSDDLDENCAVYKFIIKDELMNEVGKPFCYISIYYNNQELVTNGFNYTIKQDPLGQYNIVLLNDPDMPLLRSLLEEIKNNVGGIDDENVRDDKSFSSYKTTQIANNLSSQIKEKASKSEVFLLENGININDFDEETRQTFLNQQGIDVNYVLGEGNVKYENLSKNIQSDFLDGVTYLENLLDTTKFVVGGLYSDGSLSSDVTDNYCSDFISVTPNKVYYRLKTNIVVIGYYDKDKNFVSRPTIQEGVDNFTIPNNVYYIRYTNTKDNMLTEVISSVPITKYNNYLNGIYEISGKYKLLEHSIGIEELETNMPPTFLQSNSITKDLLSNYILGEPEFLANGFDLNTLGRDGYFVCTDCINKPDGMGTAFLTSKVFLNEAGNGRWGIQELYDFLDVSNRYIRIVDLENPANNKAWISLNQTLETPATSKSKFEGKNLVTLGDSITQGVGVTDTSKNYPSLLQSKYGLNVVNVGISGATWANYNDGYDDISIIHQVDNADFSNVDFVTIFAGTNDFGRSNGNTIGNTTDTATNTVKGAMNYVIGKILTQNPNVKIAIITPMWRQRFSAGDNKDSDTNTLGGQYLIDYVNAIEEQAKYNHIPCLNLYETCLINKHNYSIYLSDGLHPNDKGYELLADKICSFLESVY